MALAEGEEVRLGRAPYGQRRGAAGAGTLRGLPLRGEGMPMPGCPVLGVAAGPARDGTGPGILFVGCDSSALSRAEDEEKQDLWVGFPVAGSLMLAAPPATVVRTPCEEGRRFLQRCARALCAAWCAGALPNSLREFVGRGALRVLVARIRGAKSVARGSLGRRGADVDTASSFCEPVCTPGLEARRNNVTGWKPIPQF